MEKGTATQGMYEKFSGDEKARVAKCAADVRTIQHYTKSWPDCPLKEGTIVVDRVVLFQLQRTIHP